MPTGRPTAYRTEYAAQARKLCLLGATNDDLAKFFDVAVSTVGQWLSKQPEFSVAVKEGREEADAKVASRLYKRAMGYSHPAVKIMQYEGAPVEVPYTERYPPDTAACIFWLKNRRPDKWRDKQDIEHSGNVEFAERLVRARERRGS